MGYSRLSSGNVMRALLFCLLGACESGGHVLDHHDSGTDSPSDDTASGCDGSGVGSVGLAQETISFDWWEGEEVPVHEVSLALEDPGCDSLIAQFTEEWLTVSLTTESLVLSLDDDAVVSGHHSAELVLWDTDTDAAAASVTVELSALVRPEEESSRNVLVIGVDGLDGEEMRDISVPVMEQLMDRGFWSYAAQTQLTEATSSGPGWTSILTGVEAATHGISSNSGYEDRNTDYPSFLYRAKEELGLGTAASIQWSDIWEILESDAYEATGSGDMAEVAETMTGLVRSGLYEVHFVHLDDVDGAGHSVGYLASESSYVDAVQEVDGMIGEMVDAILERPEIETEHWLVLVTSDHGGDIWGSHGTMSSDYQTIPLIIAGPGLGSTQLEDSEGSHMDIHPTVIDFLGLDPDDYGLDGHSWWERERDCDDGDDNDDDGLVDCEDPDCESDIACLECPAHDLEQATGTHLVDDVPFDESARTGSCGGEGPESTYAWTAPESGRYSFDTVGAYRDTVLYALDGDCEGEELACSDDISGLGSGRSGFSLDVEAGDELVIVVDSYSSSESNPSVLSIHPYTTTCPDGDLGAETGSWSGTHTTADRAHQEACPPAVGNLEFTWTAPEDGTYTYSTAGTHIDTVIYVLEGCGGAEVTCNDDTTDLLSQVSFSASEGEEFIIGLGGFNQAEGDYVITIE